VPTAVAIRHVAFEDLGILGALLDTRGYDIRYLEPMREDPAEAAVGADLLAILGGPIGAYEDDAYPWLGREVAAVERRLAAGRPTLGLCLGAQIMARALGARVYPGGAKEIGWDHLVLTQAGRDGPLTELDGVPVLHWHGDTFDLPEGARLLASTDRYAHQAFDLGPGVLGLQFHPEVTAEGLEAWFVGHTAEIAAAGLSVPALRAYTAEHAATLKRAGTAMLGRWLDALEAD